jgi:hypothetical protein
MLCAGDQAGAAAVAGAVCAGAGAVCAGAGADCAISCRLEQENTSAIARYFIVPAPFFSPRQVPVDKARLARPFYEDFDGSDTSTSASRSTLAGLSKAHIYVDSRVQ